MSFDPQHPQSDLPSALPPGTRLGEFELLHVLGVGGFGIVYFAFDHALERDVAVKEYMPASLAGRTETLHVSLRSQSDANTFALGRKSFVNEARLLARFDHPSLVKVHRFWEANGTAYMAMPVLRGSTLRELRRMMERTPDEAWLRGLLDPLLGAIERLHVEGVYHRDIAPDNIQIEPDGRPVLLDFGAARRVISDKSQALTAILKPAYAPIEQYGEAGSVRQGPWTDIYALGATLHFMLTGRPPLPATARAVHDDMQPLAAQTPAGCTLPFLQTIDWMLAPRPTDRPQSVAALREVLAGRVAPPVRRVTPAAPVSDWETTRVLTPAPWAMTAPATERQAGAGDDAGTVLMPLRAAAADQPVVSPAPATEAAAPSPSRSILPALLGGAGLLLVAAVWFFWPRTPALPAPQAELAASSPTVALALTAGTAPALAQAAADPAPVADMPAPTLKPESTAAFPAPLRSPGAVAAASRPAATRPQAVVSPAAKSRTRGEAPDAAVIPALPVAIAVALPLPRLSPKERCGDRVLLSLWTCIERQCNQPDMLDHPDCLKLRADHEQRANPTHQ